MLKSVGPVGHCSARLRKLLEIEEEIAGGLTIRIKDVAADSDKSAQGSGSRWARKANFAVPAPFHTRPVSSSGSVSFHFAVATVSKAHAGRSVITVAGQQPVETGSTAADNAAYITREGAVETIPPAAYAAYSARDGAVDYLAGEIVAHFTNIHEDANVRQDYWKKVHDCERERRPDRLVFHPDRLPCAAWKRIELMDALPSDVRQMAAEFAKGIATKQNVKPRSIDLPAAQAKKVIAIIRASGEIWSRKRPPVRVAQGRGGRTQYRFVAELPADIDALARGRIVSAFCSYFAEMGVMYEAVIHRPDAHNDPRNFHLHLAAHDRPAKLMGERWDFEIAVTVEGQSGRVNYPYRQRKVAAFVRSTDGTDHRAYAAGRMCELRKFFAELCNEELAAIDSPLRYDPRRLEQMGIDRKPTKPLGTRAAPLEAAGVPTRLGIANAEIIWNYELQQAARQCQAQADDRHLLKKRLAAALERAEGAGDAATAACLKDDLHILTEQAAVLDSHQAELAIYDTTLTMARARPDKTIETCRAILETVAEGTASRSDRNAAGTIQARLDEAAAFLAKIDRVTARDASGLTEVRAAVGVAQREVQAVTQRLAAIAHRAPLQVGSARLRPSPPANDAIAAATRSSDRDTVEALMERVLASDIPIIWPDPTNPKFRVPGITRDELRIVTQPAWEGHVQKRLSGIAEIQAKRMRSAAELVARMGMPALELQAHTDAEAGRALKHANAYREHPIFQERLRERSAAMVSSVPSVEGRRINPFRRLVRSLANSLDGLFPPEAISTSQPTDQCAVSPPAKAPDQPLAAPEPPETIDSRQAAIDNLAAALINDHRLRVAMIGGELTITPTEDGWERSIDAFCDEPAVQKAVVQRHSSPWLDVASDERAAIIEQIRDALRSPDRRPIARAGTGWVFSGIPDAMAEQIRHWDGYGELQEVLRKVENFWTYKEGIRDNHPTALPERPAPEIGVRRPHRAPAIPRQSTGLDPDSRLRDQIWEEWQKRGQSL